MANPVSELFDAAIWQQVKGFENQTDITYHQHVSMGVVRIAFNRPEIRNAFRPKTVDELAASLEHAKNNSKVGVVLLTGNGPSPKDGGWAFSSGGDQNVRGKEATNTLTMTTKLTQPDQDDYIFSRFKG